MNLTKEEETVRNILINVASKTANILFRFMQNGESKTWYVNPCWRQSKIGEVLGHISRYEHENGRPLISSVVVSRSHGNQGDGSLN